MRVRDYLNTDAHHDLIEQLGLPEPLGDPERFVLATYQLDDRYVLKQGEEPLVRWRLEGIVPSGITPEQHDAINSVATTLGMNHGSKSPFGAYAGMAFLGAARMAPRDRLEHLLKALRSGYATTDWLGGVGSGRILDEEEQKVVESYARGAKKESDLVQSAWNDIKGQYADVAETVNILRVESQSARNMDVMRLVMETLHQEHLLHDEAVVTFSTNRIYEAFTTVDAAILNLDYLGVHIEIVSCPASEAALRARNDRTYRSEIMRTYRAMIQALELGLDPELPCAA
jgi:hypothetical protein